MIEQHVPLMTITTPDGRVLQIYWPSDELLEWLIDSEKQWCHSVDHAADSLVVLDTIVQHCSDFDMLHRAGFGADWKWFIVAITRNWKYMPGMLAFSTRPEFDLQGIRAFVIECMNRHEQWLKQFPSVQQFIREIEYQDAPESTNLQTEPRPWGLTACTVRPHTQG